MDKNGPNKSASYLIAEGVSVQAGVERSLTGSIGIWEFQKRDYLAETLLMHDQCRAF